MQTHRKTMQLAAIAGGGILLTATALRPQPRAGGPGWQYCSVTAVNDNNARAGRAAICYSTEKGCRDEEITSRGWADAEMAAAATLGNQGWELISATQSGQEHTLYFKRLKALDNQHPLGN